MKWSKVVALLVVSVLVGFSGSVVASERAEEARQMTDNLLEQSDPDARAAALVVIGYVGDDEQQARIEEFRRSTHEPERLAAAAALIVAGDSDGVAAAAEQLLEASSTYEASRTLSTYLDDGQLGAVIDRAVGEADDSQRRDLFRFLGAQTGPLYDNLTNRLTSSDDKEREAAHQAVVYTAGEAALELATGLATHRTAAIRMQALDIAEKLVGRADLRSSIVELLEGRTGDADREIKMRSARQLVELDERRGAQVLLDLLSELDADDRVETVEFLLKHDVRASIDTVRPLIEEIEGDEDEQGERTRERQLLYELAATDADRDLAEQLRDKFTSTDIDERIIAVRALGRTNQDGALDLLGRGLGEGRSDIRRYSARGFGHIADAQTLNQLRSALTGESNKEIRLELIRSVGRIRDARSAQVLRFLVRDSDPEVRMAVVEALDQIALPESVGALEMLVQDRDVDVKWNAFMALLRLDVDKARGHVGSMFRNPPNTFAQHLNPYAMSPGARKAVYEQLLSHDANRVRSVGVEHVTAHRDVLLSVARDMVLSSDIHEDARRDLVFLLISEGDDEDMARFQQVLANFSDEPAAQVAGWHLARSASAELEEDFEEIAEEDEESIVGLVARLGLAKL